MSKVGVTSTANQQASKWNHWELLCYGCGVTLQLGKDPGSKDKYFNTDLAVFTTKKSHRPTTPISCPLLGTYNLHLIWRRLASTSVKTAEGWQNWHVLSKNYISSYLIVLITFCVTTRNIAYYGNVRLCVCPRPHAHTTARTRMPPSCAVLGGFAIGARVALLWQHKAKY